MKTNHRNLVCTFIIFGLLLVLASSCSKSDDDIKTVVDIDGNVYKTVTIGTQVWMAENLKTTKYNDGTAIPLVTGNTAWEDLTTPAYCWYGNVEATSKKTYGALYNYYTVISGKLCPTGWHVPADVDWTVLTTYVGGDTIAGRKLKEAGNTHWQIPNTEAANETGFTALPAGYRTVNGVFDSVGQSGYWWTSTGISMVSAWNRTMSYAAKGVSKTSSFTQNGFSVRCLKD